MQISALFLILLTLPTCCFAEQLRPSAPETRPHRYSVDRWSIEEGLPNNALTAVMPGVDGYLWVAGLAGAVRFDGVRFTPVLESLPNAHFRSLSRDSRGNVWIGMVGAGLARYKDGRSETYGPAQLAGSEVRTLAEGSDGRVWVGTDNGVNVIDAAPDVDRLKANGHILTIRKEQGLPGNSVRAIVRSRAGIWIATDEGVCLARNLNLRCSGQRNLSQTAALAEDEAGRLWAGGPDGLFSMQSDFSPAGECAAGCFSGRAVTSLLTSRNGGLWVGFNDGGIALLDIGTGANGRGAPVEQYGAPEGLTAGPVAAIAEDPEGSVWIAAYNGGLERLRSKRVKMYSTADGLPAKVVGSIVQDPRGTIWVGSQCGPVSEFRGGRFVPRFAEYTKDACPIALWAARDGSLWIGSDHGLFRWYRNRMEHFGLENGLSDLHVQALFESRDGVIWIGTLRGGLHTYSQGRLSRGYGTADGVAAGEIENFAQDHDGRVWIGSNGKGLSVFENGHFRILTSAESPPENDISGLFVDSTGDLWVATDRNGLFRRHKNRWVAFGVAQRVGDRLVAGMLEDRAGTLWISTASGISRVERNKAEAVAEGRSNSLDPAILDRTDGMLNPEVSGGGFDPTGMVDREGRLWFSTIDGIAVVDPAEFRTNRVEPQVVIETVATAGKTISASGGVFNIPAGGPSMEVTYTGLSFLAPRKVRFRYRMREVSPEWQDAGSRRTAFYPHLPAGKYTFEVVAANNDGFWSKSPAALQIEVASFWWERTSARIAGLVLLLVGTGFAVRSLTSRRAAALAAELDRQLELERERSRIARDIHDDLGSRLTRMALMADSGGAASGTELAAAAREAIQAMDELVWTVNTRNDTVDAFVSYAVAYAEEYLRAAHIRVRVNTSMHLTEAELDAERRRHLFLSYKEALHNVVKHSGASEVQLRFETTAGKLTVDIGDNGRGFDPSHADPTGNGLRGMRERILAAGGQMQIESRGRSGTGVHIHVPFM